jgi:Cdc6-like AAA superfamily ATPase
MEEEEEVATATSHATDASDLPGDGIVAQPLLDMLSPSSRRALDFANRFRVARSRRDIHMEHLLIGLFENPAGATRPAFAAAGLDELSLGDMLRRGGFDSPRPGEVTTWGPTDEPLQFSRHVAETIEHAGEFAAQASSDRIRTRDLLKAFFLVDCRVVHPFRVVEPLVTEIVAEFERADLAATRSVGRRSAAINDRVAREDQLGFVHYVKAFADLIEAPETQPPLTIGIFGSWGMGKSFLLKHIAKELNARETTSKENRRRIPYVHIVRFNAWEYNATERIWPGLVRKVMDEVDHLLRWWTWPRLLARRVSRKLERNLAGTLREHWGRILFVATIMGVLGYFVVRSKHLDLGAIDNETDFKLFGAAFGFLSALLKLLWDTIGSPFGNWVAAVTAPRERYGAPIDYMRDIREDLQLLDLRLRKGAPPDDSDDDGFGDQKARAAALRRAESRRERPRRVLIVIDDLDRCEPDKAVEVLQAINLLLNFDSFIVCMGIDARVITGAVERHYKDLLGPAGISGYEYLDKIIQIPFRIPTPSEGDLGRFLETQLGRTPTPPRSPAPQVQGGETTTGDEPASDSSPTLSPSGAVRDESTKERGKPATQSIFLVPWRLRLTADRPAPIEPENRFSETEVAAFRSMTPFLRPNPRHVKRMVNVYLLVRSLREQQYPGEPLPPFALVRWLVTCGQWPYTCHRILERFDEIERDRVGNETVKRLYDEIWEDPIFNLYADSATEFDEARRNRLDDDPDLLDRLLRMKQGRLTWPTLQTLRQYTINFNPAVESEAMSVEQRKEIPQGEATTVPSPRAL